MYRQIKQLLQDFVTYGFGQILTKVVGFFLLPVYTRLLTPSDYGVLALLAMFASLLFIFINVGMSTGIFRFYLDKEEPEYRDSVLFTAFVIMIVMAAPCLAIVVFRDPIARALFGQDGWSGLLVLATTTIYLDLLLKLPFSSMRALRQSKRYSVLNVIQTMTELLLALTFVVGFRLGALGVVLGQFCGTSLMAVYLVPRLVLGLRRSWSPAIAKGLLLFGLPLVPAGLATFVLTLTDRYMLKYFSTLDQVGLYSVGYRFGQIITFAVMAFQLAWPPFVFSQDKREDSGRLFARIATYYVVGLGTVCLLLDLFSREMFLVVVGPEFRTAYTVVGLIAASQFFFGLYNITSAGILLKRKTVYTALLVGAAAGVNLGLNFWFIPRFGMMGAAWTTLIAYGLLFWLALLVSQRMYPIPFEWGRLLRYAAAAAGVALVARWVTPESMLVSIVVKLLLVSAVPLTLILTGFFERNEIDKTKKLLQELRRATGAGKRKKNGPPAPEEEP
jgi:O-antigen/teichoic acid export membrane protein